MKKYNWLYAVGLLLVYGAYKQCNESRTRDNINSYRDEYVKRKNDGKRIDSFINYNIDSFLLELKKDKEYGITFAKYESSDSGIFIIANPKFDYTNREVTDSIYLYFFKKHLIQYALNVAAVSISVPFTKEQASKPDFTLPIIWTIAKPNTQAWNQFRSVYPNDPKMIKY